MIKLINLLPLEYYAFSGLVNFITALTISIIVFLFNKKSPTNRIFSVFSLSVAYWSLLYFFWLNVKDKEWAEFYLRSCMIGVLFMPSLFFHFVLLFLKKKVNRKFLIGNYILSILFTLTVYTTLYAKDISRHLVFPYWLHTGPIFHLALAHFGLVVFYSFLLMWQSIKKERGIFRNQIMYVFLGTAIGYISGITNFFCWYRINIPPFLNIFVSVYVILVALAIVRYRLMDINLALTRAGIFIVVYALVLGLPFWLGYRYQLWMHSTWIMLALATLGPFIYTYLRRQAEKRLRAEERRYQKTLLGLAKTMTRIRDLDQLLKAIVLTVVDAVRISFAAVYLKDEEYKSYRLKHWFPKKEQARFQELIPLDNSLIKLLYQQKKPLVSEETAYQDKASGSTALNTGLVIPCFIEKDELLGFLVLGAKPNNQIYTNDDLLVFETLSYSTSLAIENSTFWKEIEDRHRKARLQEMDTYSYSLAHEIDNPMQVVIGQANLLKKYMVSEVNVPEDKKQELNESFDFILEAARRVSSMVKAIRDFGQPITGVFKPLKIEDVVESFSKLYFPQFKANGVIFEKDIPANLGYLRGEKPELMQALVILANNSLHAMKYSQEKKIFLKIERTNNDAIKISFSDTGYGIKKELLPIIFAPFTTTKASSEGTGMGLYNAKKIVERHKGRIWVESEGEGKGATFFIELPVSKEITQEDFIKDDKQKRIF